MLWLTRRATASWRSFWMMFAAVFCLAAGLIAMASLRYSTTGVQTLRDALIAGVLCALLLVAFSSLLFRWIHCGKYETTVRALESVFSVDRVTSTEWNEAKRIVRANEGDFLDFGVDRYFEAKCVLDRA